MFLGFSNDMHSYCQLMYLAKIDFNSVYNIIKHEISILCDLYFVGQFDLYFGGPQTILKFTLRTNIQSEKEMYHSITQLLIVYFIQDFSVQIQRLSYKSTSFKKTACRWVKIFRYIKKKSTLCTN